eukprot:TRINITY_DN10871_c0_g1_i1.p1 TRINITY_DN10871_c0_g1~~TRINITY_DN10871_c0_g1_i1.p1  ORF type:complete len:522 (-),score=108.22 TRINITY_DN10871_c0_g1_i1:10-1575(-)
MEVNNKNFQEKLPHIITAITNCDFVSVDTEFTGITLSLRDRGHQYDTMEDRYQKLKFICQNYLSWQLGLTTFRYNAADNNYLCHTFVFPVFPRHNSISKRSFVFSSDALKFLSKHNFPFESVIENGIGYQQLAKEKKVEEDIEKYILKSYAPPVLKVAPGKDSLMELEALHAKTQKWLATEEQTLELSYSSAFVRDYFLKGDLSKKFGVEGIEKQKVDELSTVLTKTKRYRQFLKTKAKGQTEETKAQQADYKLKEAHSAEELKKKELEEEMGISRVIMAIMNSKKPLLGHNFIYDVGFLYHQYIDDLPETYVLFKKRFHDCFPAIYDTKVIAHSYKNQIFQYDLPHLLKKCIELNKGMIKFVFPTECKDLETVKEEHSAGFDSFCAGKVFVIMAKLIEIRVLKNPSYHTFQFEEGAPESDGIESSKEKEKEKVKKEEKKDHPVPNGTTVEAKKEEKKVFENPRAKLDAMLAGFKHGPAGGKKNQNDFAQTSTQFNTYSTCLLYTSPSPRDATLSRMPSSA